MATDYAEAPKTLQWVQTLLGRVAHLSRLAKRLPTRQQREQ